VNGGTEKENAEAEQKATAGLNEEARTNPKLSKYGSKRRILVTLSSD